MWHIILQKSALSSFYRKNCYYCYLHFTVCAVVHKKESTNFFHKHIEAKYFFNEVSQDIFSFKNLKVSRGSNFFHIHQPRYNFHRLAARTMLNFTGPDKYLNILRLPRVVKQLATSATRCATVAGRHCLQLVRLLTVRARHAQYYNRVFPARVTGLNPGLNELSLCQLLCLFKHKQFQVGQKRWYSDWEMVKKAQSPSPPP